MACCLPRVKKDDMTGSVGPSCLEQVANLSLPRTVKKKEFSITQDLSYLYSSGVGSGGRYGSEGEMTGGKLRHMR